MAFVSKVVIAVLVSFESLQVAVAGSGHTKLPDAELRQYDGTDTTKPIYLAINGTIFDVSVSPSFYGPGGHYHHFVGRDASRAWVTECWDSEEQLTWKMDGVEDMFMPKYLDEELEKASQGDPAAGLDLGPMSNEQVIKLATEATAKFGKVSDKEKAKRLQGDAVEARQRVHDTLAHWVKFFENNSKYSVAGYVVYDKDNSENPPKLCEAALKKRPLKGGKLDSLLNVGQVDKGYEGKDEL